jgi:hypothetical protein
MGIKGEEVSAKGIRNIINKIIAENLSNLERYQSGKVGL